jgi:hypothetical protein
MKDYRGFVQDIRDWVKGINNPDLNRAWKITQGVCTVHALVDGTSDFTPTFGRVWEDFFSAYKGEESTYLMAALVEDLKIAVPANAEPLGLVLERAYRDHGRSKGRGRAKQVFKMEIVK